MGDVTIDSSENKLSRCGNVNATCYFFLSLNYATEEKIVD